MHISFARYHPRAREMFYMEDHKLPIFLSTMLRRGTLRRYQTLPLPLTENMGKEKEKEKETKTAITEQ